MSFQIYKFVDESIMALPTSWEKSGKVPYGPNARNYISKGKEPPKVWKMYDVTPLDGRVYTTYSSALEAEALLINQSDINSSDFDRINAPQKKNSSLKKRKSHNPPPSPSSPIESAESSDDGFEDLPAVPVKKTFSCHNAHEFFTFAPQSTAVEEVLPENRGEIQSTSTSTEQIQAANTEQVESTVQVSSVIPTSFIAAPRQEVILPYEQNESDETSMITQNSDDTIVVDNVLYSFDENTLRKIIREELAAFQTREVQECSTTTFEKEHNFPLQNLVELQKFDQEFENNSDLKHKFISYIRRRGGINVKKHLEILNRIYSISLQENVSYTGRQGNKFALMNLHHIKSLIGILASVHDDTESNVTSVLRTYLHQTCTRKAAASRKPL